VRIAKSEDFEDWLKETQPQQEICVALAARAALRALPLVSKLLLRVNASQQATTLAAAGLRATALARVVGKYPTVADHVRGIASDAAKAARDAGSIISDLESASATAYAVASAVALAADAAASVDNSYVNACAAAIDAAAASNLLAEDEDEAMWHAVDQDVSLVVSGGLGGALADAPLWHGRPPDFARTAWDNLGAALPDKDGWAVWKDWYSERLTGALRYKAHEMIFVSAPPEVWEDGPNAANAWIRAQLADQSKKKSEEKPDPASVPRQPPAIPAAKPATIEPIISAGRIVLPPEPAELDLDASAFADSLHALRTLLVDLADDLAGEANIDRRAIALLRKIAGGVPETTPTQAELFILAHQQEMLEVYSKTVVAEWPDLLASRYLSVSRFFDGAMRQFAKWRVFKQNALKDRLTREQRAEVPILGRKFALALREAANAVHVDKAVALTIEAIAEELELKGQPTLALGVDLDSADTRPEDLILSLENTVKRMGEAAARSDLDKKTKLNFGANVVIGFKNQFQGEKLGENLGKWATSALLGAGGVYAGAHASDLSAVVAEMMRQFPNYSEWLLPLIEHLKRQ
jgi:hypothetical protein